MNSSEFPVVDRQSNQNTEFDHRMNVSVDIALFTVRNEEFQVLLIERGINPFRFQWALPGGRIRSDIGDGETPEEAAYRELEEETGISKDLVGYLEQLGAYGKPKRDPRNRVISIAYFGIRPMLDDPKGGSDASKAEFMPVDQIEQSLAFDHDEILSDAIDRARAKLEYSTIATEFCGEEFTITELRKVYEIVWGVSLNPGNFQKKVLSSTGFVEDTGRNAESSSTGGRPARLYRSGSAALINLPIRRS